jgi:hypothetical protein
MENNTTVIKDPSAPEMEPKRFTFDFSYWSHDDFTERDDGYLAPNSPRYADQIRVFDDLGRGVLANAWQGYNCSLFAYGQTGSGKSYSIVGYGSNKGLCGRRVDILQPTSSIANLCRDCAYGL